MLKSLTQLLRCLRMSDYISCHQLCMKPSLGHLSLITPGTCRSPPFNYLKQPHTKSMTAQIEKKSRGLRRFIRQHYE
jgi:hypothetical protein